MDKPFINYLGASARPYRLLWVQIPNDQRLVIEATLDSRLPDELAQYFIECAKTAGVAVDSGVLCMFDEPYADRPLPVVLRDELGQELAVFTFDQYAED